jgi:hypothetical protein
MFDTFFVAINIHLFIYLLCWGSLSFSISLRFHGGFSSLGGHKAYSDTSDDSLLKLYSCCCAGRSSGKLSESSPGSTRHYHRQGKPAFSCSFSNAISHIFLFKVNRCLNFTQCCGAGAEESKLNCLLEPEPKSQIAASDPASFLTQTWRNLYKKIMVAEEVFVNCYNFITLLIYSFFLKVRDFRILCGKIS